MQEIREAGGPAARVLRKDAEENRLRLLSAARELVAERGADVTLHDIAAAAGVGVGTAYRRFAGKDEVLSALFDLQVEELSDLADRALADPEPWNGLVSYLEGAMTLQANDRALAQFLSGDRVRPDQHDWSRDVLAPKINAIAARARASGALRDDVQGTDLIFIQVGLNAILQRTRNVAPALYRRYLLITLDGLRGDLVDRPAPDVPPLSVADTHAVMGPASPRATGAPAAETGLPST